MVIPEYAVVTGGFGTSDCSTRAAADGWPHPGLVEIPNIVDATPPRAWPAATGFLQRPVLRDLEVLLIVADVVLGGVRREKGFAPSGIRRVNLRGWQWTDDTTRRASCRRTGNDWRWLPG